MKKLLLILLLLSACKKDNSTSLATNPTSPTSPTSYLGVWTPHCITTPCNGTTVDPNGWNINIQPTYISDVLKSYNGNGSTPAVPVSYIVTSTNPTILSLASTYFSPGWFLYSGSINITTKSITLTLCSRDVNMVTICTYHINGTISR